MMMTKMTMTDLTQGRKNRWNNPGGSRTFGKNMTVGKFSITSEGIGSRCPKEVGPHVPGKSDQNSRGNLIKLREEISPIFDF